MFAFALRDPGGPYTVFEVSERFRENGWLVPAYFADLLVADLKSHMAHLDQLQAPLPQPAHDEFHH